MIQNAVRRITGVFGAAGWACVCLWYAAGPVVAPLLFVALGVVLTVQYLGWLWRTL